MSSVCIPGLVKIPFTQPDPLRAEPVERAFRIVEKGFRDYQAAITCTNARVDGVSSTIVAGTLSMRKNSGIAIGPRGRINLIEGANITISLADDPASPGEFDVTINAVAGAIGFNTCSNLGTGSPVFHSQLGVDFRFRSIRGGGPITSVLSGDGLMVDIGATTTPVGATVVVGSFRRVDTAAPLFGGGDLTSDRTIQLDISPAGSTQAVGTTRRVDTLPPLFGGGDLSANRTIQCDVLPIGSTVVVGTPRRIDTVLPLTGGSDLGADRTLGIQVSPGAATTVVGTTRVINGTAPIRINGGASADLTADITISLTGSGVSGIVPIGGIILWSGSIATIPANWGLCDGTLYGAVQSPDLRDRFIPGAGGTYAVNDTGGADSITPAGTNSAPTFSGIALGTHTHADGSYATDAVSAGTPAGTNSAPTFTGSALGTHTHADGSYATDAVSAGTPAGTNTAPIFTGTALGTHIHSADGTLATNAVSAGTPAGTVASHTHTFTGNALGTHSHTVSVTVGEDCANFEAIVGLTNTYMPCPVEATGSTSSDSAGTPSGTNSSTAPAFVGSALGTHSHDVTGNTSATSAGTPAGTNTAPVFTGSALGTHSHDVTGTSGATSAGTPAGTISAPVFTGDPLGTHAHDVTGTSGATSAGTPAGTVSAPVFTGTSFDNRPQYYALAYIIRIT